MKFQRSALALLTFVGMAALVPQAHATIEIRLSNNGVDTGWLTCGGAGITCTSIPGVVNSISFNGSVGNYVVNASTGTQLNTGGTPFLDLGSQNTTVVTPPGQLVIETIITDFTIQTPGWSLIVNGNGGIGGTATFTAYGGNNNNSCPLGVNACTPPNAPPANLNLITTSGALPVMLLPAGFHSTTVGTGTTTSPYSLGMAAVIDGANQGTVSFDAALDPVPEPASVALLGGILLLGAGAIRRKLRA